MNQHSYDIIDSNLSGVIDANHLISSARNVVNCVLKNTGDIINASDMLTGGNRPTTLATLNALDLHSATTIRYLLHGATSLVSPLNITLGGAITNCNHAFYNCKKVPSGAKALYDVLSTQTTLPTDYSNCFTGCGSSTDSGRTELAQIPTSWGGTMQE
jgi:hypothetical protein